MSEIYHIISVPKSRLKLKKCVNWILLLLKTTTIKDIYWNLIMFTCESVTTRK